MVLQRTYSRLSRLWRRMVQLGGSTSTMHSPSFSSPTMVTVSATFSHQTSPPPQKGFNLLGSPIAPPSFCEGTRLKRVEKVKATLSRLPDLEDSQLETTLLRSCLALPKVAFSLRCCPPSHIKETISVFDDAMRDTLGDISGDSITDWG